jgi:hypothetical protein
MEKSVLVLALLLGACTTTPPIDRQPSASASASVIGARDVADCEPLGRRLKLGEECVRPDQAEHYKNLGLRMQAVQAKMPMDPKNQVDSSVAGGIRRPLHAKAHACVKAVLVPAKDLPAPYANGLLSDGRSHQTWVRFSNAQGLIEKDSDHDARGLAIKVMGVKGPRLTGGNEAQTQDFLTTNKPRGTARNSEDFVKFIEASAKGKAAQLAYFAAGREDQMLALLKVSNKKVDSMAKETYWSGGPFLWGSTSAGQPVAAKFKLQPCTDVSGKLPSYLASDLRTDSPSPTYLREDLKTLLASHDLCFAMSVQVQRDVVKQPIEDGFQLWNESEAPARTVAYLRIPKQVFDTDKQDEFCERLTFNPWNGLEAHRPLGDLNRARRFVYAAVQHSRLEALPVLAGDTQVPAEPLPNDANWKLNPL